MTWGCLTKRWLHVFVFFIRRSPKSKKFMEVKKMNAKAKRLLSLALSTLMVSSTVSFAIPAAAEEGPMG